MSLYRLENILKYSLHGLHQEGQLSEVRAGEYLEMFSLMSDESFEYYTDLLTPDELPAFIHALHGESVYGGEWDINSSNNKCLSYAATLMKAGCHPAVRLTVWSQLLTGRLIIFTVNDISYCFIIIYYYYIYYIYFIYIN